MICVTVGGVCLMNSISKAYGYAYVYACVCDNMCTCMSYVQSYLDTALFYDTFLSNYLSFVLSCHNIVTCHAISCCEWLVGRCHEFLSDCSVTSYWKNYRNRMNCTIPSFPLKLYGYTDKRATLWQPGLLHDTFYLFFSFIVFILFHLLKLRFLFWKGVIIVKI